MLVETVSNGIVMNVAQIFDSLVAYKGVFMIGTYKEKLSTGGELTISANTWSISYYIPGIDLRYKGEFFSISGVQIDDYINALKKNFVLYEELKNKIPKGGEYTTNGQLNMQVRIGNFNSGVCLHKYHLNISNRNELNKIIAEFEYSKTRAKQIQEMLLTLDN